MIRTGRARGRRCRGLAWRRPPGLPAAWRPNRRRRSGCADAAARYRDSHTPKGRETGRVPAESSRRPPLPRRAARRTSARGHRSRSPPRRAREHRAAASSRSICRRRSRRAPHGTRRPRSSNPRRGTPRPRKNACRHPASGKAQPDPAPGRRSEAASRRSPTRPAPSRAGSFRRSSAAVRRGNDSSAPAPWVLRGPHPRRMRCCVFYWSAIIPQVRQCVNSARNCALNAQ